MRSSIVNDGSVFGVCLAGVYEGCDIGLEELTVLPTVILGKPLGGVLRENSQRDAVPVSNAWICGHKLQNGVRL